MKRTALDHPKMDEVSAALKVPIYAARGLLEAFWHLTGRQIPSGAIGKFSNAAIARKCDWDGDPDEFVNALVAAKFINEHDTLRLVVHDWSEHCDDAVHLALARSGQVFWDGTWPRLNRLPMVERKRIEGVLKERFGTKRTESVLETLPVRAIARTTNAQKAAPLPSPPLPSPAIPFPAVPRVPPPADTPPAGDGSVRGEAEAAFDRWSDRERRHGLIASHDETRKLGDFLDGLCGDPPVIHAGAPVRPLVLVPQVVSVLMTKGTAFKGIKFAVTCVANELNDWRNRGLPDACAGPDPTDAAKAVEIERARAERRAQREQRATA